MSPGKGYDLRLDTSVRSPSLKDPLTAYDLRPLAFALIGFGLSSTDVAEVRLASLCARAFLLEHVAMSAFKAFHGGS